MDTRLLIVSCARGRLAGSLVVLLCLAQIVAGQVPTPGFSREAADSAANKFRKIQDGSAPDQALVSVRISELELNSYSHYEWEPKFPPGISKIHLQLLPGRVRVTAAVDFDELTGTFRVQPHPFAYFLRGVHTLGAEGTLSASSGAGLLHFETGTLDDQVMPQMVVEFLIGHYLKSRYPDIAIDHPFPLDFSIEKLNVELGSLFLEGRHVAAASESEGPQSALYFPLLNLVPSPSTLSTKRASSATAFRRGAAARAVQPRSAERASSTQQQIVASYGRLPLSFEANRGQTDAQVKFISRSGGHSLFLTSTEAVLNLPSRDRERAVPPATTTSAALRMKLVGSNPSPQVTGLDELPGKSNYLIGNDPSQWRTKVPHYAKVKYQGVYPGVDLVYHGFQQQLEYDYVVAPGADPGAIRLRFQGAGALKIDAQGDLVLHTAAGDVREHKPVVYQEIAGVRQAITGNYVLRGSHQVSFEIGRYDTSKPLVIDPVLSYSTYLGGSGSESGNGIAVDAAGNTYVTGSTSSTDFPTTPGTLGPVFRGGADVFVTKIATTSSGAASLVYSTYLGGSNFDTGSSIAVDASGNAYVTGQTQSTDFPTQNPFQKTKGGTMPGPPDAFVATLDSSGSMLLYSTFLGGGSFDTGNGIAVDASGNAYVTGLTNSTDFPTQSPLQQSKGSGNNSDAFVAKIDTTASGAASLVYSTYLGGSNTDSGSSIAVDAARNAYVTGSTQSSNFPTAQALQDSYGGGNCFAYYYYSPQPCADTFVAKLNPAGSALVFSTYLGGDNDDRGDGIAVDSSGNIYLTGHTSSKNFPTAKPIQPALSGFGDAFVAELNPAGSALIYSTYLGGSNDEEGRSITVDPLGNAYVAGFTSSTDFPTVFPVQVVLNGDSHAFVTKLNPTGSALVYSSYLAGTLFESGAGIAVDSAGNAHVTGQTSSADFPTVNSLKASLGGFNDAFVAKIAPIPGPAVATSPGSLTFPSGQPLNTTSPPQTVTLTNRGDGALTITGIMIAGRNSGDFAQTNTCGTLPATLAPGASCALNVTFTPTETGTRRGTVTISDSAVGSPHTVSLLGNFVPPDFSISAFPSAATVSAGGAATFTVTIMPLNDFTGQVVLSVGGVPPLSNGSFSPSAVPVTTGGNPATTTFTIRTTAGSALLVPPFEPLRIKPLYAFLLLLPAIVLAAVGVRGRKSKRRRIVSFPTALLMVLVAWQSGCGGAPKEPPKQPQPGTPAGTYNITVTSRSGSLQHPTTVTLTVQ